MLILLITFVILGLILNIAFYEYRVLKPIKKDVDVFNLYCQLQLVRKYNAHR